MSGDVLGGVSTLPGLRTYGPEDAERINNGGPGQWLPERRASLVAAVVEAAREYRLGLPYVVDEALLAALAALDADLTTDAGAR